MCSQLSTALATEKHRLEICTLGEFSIRRGSLLLSERAKRSYKTWELFKYLLANKEKLISPERIIDTLWPDQEYSDPKTAFRVQVHRLRQLFGGTVPFESPIDVEYTRGCYTMKTDDGCWLDSDEFELLSQKAGYLPEREFEQKVDTYRNAILLYGGDYLPEVNNYWVLPWRNHYRRLYLRNILSLAELLKAVHRYTEIIEITERALRIEPLAEELHLLYMDALLKNGKAVQARNHYEEATSTIYLQVGTKPSHTMQEMYRDIKANCENTPTGIIDFYKEINESSEKSGALYCRPDYFRFVCTLEKRRAQRGSNPVFVGLVSLADPGFRSASTLSHQMLIEQLKVILMLNLRNCDIFCQWNDWQFAILFAGLRVEQAENVLKRIRDKCGESYTKQGVILRSRIHDLFPES